MEQGETAHGEAQTRSAGMAVHVESTGSGRDRGGGESCGGAGGGVAVGEEGGIRAGLDGHLGMAGTGA